MRIATLFSRIFCMLKGSALLLGLNIGKPTEKAKQTNGYIPARELSVSQQKNTPFRHYAINKPNQNS